MSDPPNFSAHTDVCSFDGMDWMDLCFFSQEIDAAQHDVREPGGLRRRSLQSRIVSGVSVFLTHS